MAVTIGFPSIAPCSMNQPVPSTKRDYTAAAKALLRRARHGILSTLSTQVPGYPFGSVLPCALTPTGEPILLISTLAAHTQNILADPHVSFTVIEPDRAGETQANARFTYLGLAEAVPEEQTKAMRDRFLALVPSASIYSGFGDFSLYIVRFTKGRFVGGFGMIGWVHAKQFVQPDPVAELALQERPSLLDLCRDSLQAVAHSRQISDVLLASADSQGVDIQVDERVERLEFSSPLPEDTTLQALVTAVDRTVRTTAG
ncbi:MAG: pyridoxamine 5'-phosphate oxidase family protein [Cyanobacteria bacterium P01_G01_bin.4]